MFIVRLSAVGYPFVVASRQLTIINADVALVSYFTGLSTAASVAQQLHTIVYWRDIKNAQFRHSIANVGNPELAIAGQSTGLDLVLFYIRKSSLEHEMRTPDTLQSFTATMSRRP